MGSKTSIEWCDSTWSPLRGCSRISTGCEKCYAERIAGRFSGPGLPYHGLAKMTKAGARWTGKVEFVPEAIDQPLHWKKPRRIFVCPTSDLFHESVKDEWIRTILGIIQASPRHTFLVLTKRADRMRRWFTETDFNQHFCPKWPIPNLWLGTSVENQEAADERIPHLLSTPAALRFLSVEPMLGPVDLDRVGFFGNEPLSALVEQVGFVNRPPIDLVIVGAESGPRARPMDLGWAFDIVRKCRAAGVKVFCKQIGRKPFETMEAIDQLGTAKALRRLEKPGHLQPGWTRVEAPDGTSRYYRYHTMKDPKGASPTEWPAELRVREMPEVKP